MTIQPTQHLNLLRMQLASLQREARSLETDLNSAEDDSEYLAIVGEILMTGWEISVIEADILELRYSLHSDVPPLKPLSRQFSDERGKLSKDTKPGETSRTVDLWA